MLADNPSITALAGGDLNLALRSYLVIHQAIASWLESRNLQIARQQLKLAGLIADDHP